MKADGDPFPPGNPEKSRSRPGAEPEQGRSRVGNIQLKVAEFPLVQCSIQASVDLSTWIELDSQALST
jgi:hypothetical protein